MPSTFQSGAESPQSKTIFNRIAGGRRTYLHASMSPWPLATSCLFAVALVRAAFAGTEDPAVRAKLPEIQLIPAARPDELTPANGAPVAAAMRTWNVSHGDAG